MNVKPWQNKKASAILGVVVALLVVFCSLPEFSNRRGFSLPRMQRSGIQQLAHQTQKLIVYVMTHVKR